MRTPHIGRVIAAGLVIGAGIPVTASAFEQGLYIGLEGGANVESAQNLEGVADANAKFKPGFVAGYITGYAFASGFRPELEIDFRRNQLRKENIAGVGSFGADGFENTISGMGNLWYDFKLPRGIFSKVHPYIGGGIGLAQVRLQHVNALGVNVDDSDRTFAYQGGAGVGYELNRHWIASVDYRYFQTERGRFSSANGGGNVDAIYRANSVMGSFRYNFGVPTPVATYVPSPPPPIEPVYVAPPAGPCRDSDGDGVCDAVDKCPGTPKGFKVDADGCIIEQKIILRSVNFEFNKDVLTGPAKESLDEVGAALVGQPKLRVEIAGYTDSIGSAAYNLNLSKKRAASVKTYLVSKGVPAGNLVSQGYGKNSPIATNATEEGRAENRRVEFSVLNKPATADVVTKGSTSASKSAAGGDTVGKKVVKKGKKKKTAKKAAAKKATAK